MCARYSKETALMREAICFFRSGFLVITSNNYKQIKLEKLWKQIVSAFKTLAVTRSLCRAEEQPAAVMRRRGNFPFLSCTQVY